MSTKRGSGTGNVFIFLISFSSTLYMLYEIVQPMSSIFLQIFSFFPPGVWLGGISLAVLWGMTPRNDKDSVFKMGGALFDLLASIGWTILVSSVICSIFTDRDKD